jgi:hypothetical protein
MEVKVLNSSNFASLSANYGLDENVNFGISNRNTYHGFDLTLDQCLSGARDTSINKYSSFYLSNEFDYKDFLTLDKLEIPLNFTFTSYIAVNSTSNVRYLSALPAEEEPVTNLVVSNYFDSNSFFEVHFLDRNNCKIKNTEGEVTRYLTYDYINSKLIMLTGSDIISPNDLNTFQYTYDKTFDYISFSKKIFDKVNYLYYDFDNDLITLQSPPTEKRTVPFDNNTLFKLRINPSSVFDKLSTSQYVYNESLDNTKLNVNTLKSDYTFNTNFLFNTEYYKINPYKSKKFDVNVLNLKNQKTVFNTQSYGNVFPDQPDFKHRYYENLFTGVNQETGNSNIGLGFASYTLTKLLKNDSLNYFHIPYEIYPYEKLNINDSSLVSSGAIASDTPYYSDKVFKKLNDYRDSSPYGDVSDTQTGSFLCSWLSGGQNINEKGIWVDRFYNPANISYYDALTNPSQGLTTNFDQISSLNTNNNIAYDLYDVKSNLTFEKGSQYAYHHIGNKNCASFVNNLSSSLFVDGLPYYFSLLYDRKINTGEIVFKGDYFTKTLTVPLDTISEFDNFSVTFDLSNDNWERPFGSQIIGNYTNKGFGIFNYRRITPYTVCYCDNEVYLFNTQGLRIKTIINENKITEVLKFEPNSLFLAFDEKGFVTKYNYIGTALDKHYLPFMDNNNDKYYYSYGDYAFLLVSGSWYRLDINSLFYKTSEELSYNETKIGNSFSGIVADNTNVYLISGYNPKVYNNDIYFNTGNAIEYFSLKNNQIGLKVEGLIVDYTFDKEGNFYCIYDDDKLVKIDNYDNITYNNKLSAVTGFNNSLGKGIDIIDEFYENKHITDYLSIISLSSNGEVGKLAYTRTKNDFTDATSSITGNDIVIDGFPYNTNINNYNYVRNNYDDGKNLECKIKLPNIYDVQTFETCTLSYPLSNISPGYHNFTVTFDTINGLFNLFIDGKNVDTYSFENIKYSFGTVFDNVMYIGTEPSYGNNKLNDNLNDINYYNYGNFKLKNYSMYNIPLYLYDIANIIRSKYKIADLLFELPTGKRSYTENIDKFFKNKLPGRKSNLLNISIQDTGINEKLLQEDITEEVFASIKKVLPANTKLNKVVWEKDND